MSGFRLRQHDAQLLTNSNAVENTANFGCQHRRFKLLTVKLNHKAAVSHSRPLICYTSAYFF